MLAEVYEDWQEKKYLDMEAFYEGARARKAAQDSGPVALRDEGANLLGGNYTTFGT